MTSNPENILSRLRCVLEETRLLAFPGFSGVGIVIWDGGSALPVTPLCLSQPVFDDQNLPLALAILGQHSNTNHDGFHVIDAMFSIRSAAMYFSPPVPDKVIWDKTKGYGGRYVAALFGSCLPGVIATGVLSVNYGVRIFADGKEV